ncbi:MAG: MFS transporter [Chlamydiales bacterium]|nr:MFS transporter [Chlamydiales bacterium]
MTTSRRQLWNACLGNLFEHYDTALFGFLSPFLAPLIFPDKEPIVALILTYAIIPLGMLARPIGSLVFGYIGDVYGRKQALFLTLAGMSFVSGCIAFTPTYSQAGILAPIIFCIGRALQNFLAAGETMGGAIFLLENSSEKRHDLFSSLYSASTMGGHLLASLGVFLLSSYNLTDPGWRFLYLCGCITALFGCLIRRSPYTVQPALKFSQTVMNLKGFWTYRKPLVCIMITSGFASATYSIALVLMNGFIPLVSTFSKTEVMKINTYLLILDFCALPFFGWAASKVPRERLMISASLGVVLCAMPLVLSLKGASLMGIIGVRIAFVIFGVAFFAPFHAWAQQLIPSTCRYAVISLGYALGTQALGSPTTALALWCFQKTGMVSSVVWYWMFLGLLSSGVIALALRKKQVQILEQI